MRTKHLLIVAIIVVIIFASISIYTTYRPPIVETAAPIFPIVIQDDLGRNIALSEYPERIISLAPSNTEILFALGLADKVVGVTIYCDYPPDVKNMVKDGRLTTIGGFANPNIEKVVALEPDLVLATGGVQLSIVQQFESYDLTVVTLDPEDLEDVVDNILLVGEITGEDEAATELAGNMEQRIDRIVNMMENVENKPRVYYEVWWDPLMSAGSGTWINDLIGIAGGVNIFSDVEIEYPEINSESVIVNDPEIIMIPVGYMGGEGEEIAKRPGWEVITAIKNDRIYIVNEDLLYKPGPRIVDGLENLAKIIHPELFE